MRRNTIAAVAHPSPDDYRMKRARLVRQSGVSEARLDNGSHPIHKVRTAPRDLPRVPDKTRQPSAAARKNAAAGPMGARQQRAIRTVHPATRHPDLNAEPGWSKISGARPEKAEHRLSSRYAGFPQLLCSLD